MYDNSIVEKILAYHGGWERWLACERLSFRLCSGGFAFAAKGQANALINRQVNIFIREQCVTLQPFPVGDLVGEWNYDRVRILDSIGHTVSERKNPHAEFFRVGRSFRWDDLDMLYFAGYALWNYLTFPYLLMEAGVRIQKISRHDTGAILHVEFPKGFPTHSRNQAFHVDAYGKLLRHDYTADVIGGWAHASNICLTCEEVDGMVFYPRRRVLPRIGRNLIVPMPKLVWIELTEIEVLKFQDAPNQELNVNQFMARDTRLFVPRVVSERRGS